MPSRSRRAAVPSISAGVPSARASQRSALRLQRQFGELSIAAPQVIHARLTRMAQAGLNPSAADRREFHTMGAEKVWAFHQAWLSMAQSMVQQQMAWWTAAFGLPFGGARRTPSWNPWLDASRALSPIHRRAVSNAKRLTGPKAR